ncbi:gallate dioxygenase [Vibrio fluvialis]|uniref:gallate dioxygenase n=1 Tax=Vibrio fluvialis TaxID=676 RepID=UPI001C9C07CA|nr:gallate dioxygenase [Vibrio fluvialis]EKO3407694.1 gallate dioxygenase [Vibrio fluvialis]EKO3495728.1 gallate dioxygenase [Vibrio fluvialis]ELP2652944.1 gallate dioxygenase [Vibrio fluvialis]MBY8039929.1 gallate dioxygenase [Vibrio fluvialis]MCE7613781.1 gallate dioxygenase [Vibrio fluvialis]
MARIIGGIGASHSPTIGYAKDTNKDNDPGWKPIFTGFKVVQEWVEQQQIDVLFMIFNDHITSFFFDHYSPFVLGVDDEYRTADEGGGARQYPAVKGHLELSRHIANSLVADEFDLSVFQKKPLDHGCFSPLSMISPQASGWSGTIVPLQVGVLQFPIPNAKRCYKLGKSLRKAIESFPDPDLRVAIVATGGLSHQVHGERCGFNNTDWDQRFLDMLEETPEALANMRLAEYAELGGMEGAEVIMWLIMRGALSDKVKKVHSATYLPSMTNIATVIFEDLGNSFDDTQAEQYRQHIQHEIAGVEKLSGTYPFGLESAHRAYRLNDFLHRLIEPAHRERFKQEPKALFKEFGLTELEQTMVAEKQWIEMIRYGVSFFLLEKLGAVVGVPNPHIYASMRGEDIDTFQKSRNVSMNYSVSGGK